MCCVESEKDFRCVCDLKEGLPCCCLEWGSEPNLQSANFSWYILNLP